VIRVVRLRSLAARNSCISLADHIATEAIQCTQRRLNECTIRSNDGTVRTLAE
jgi:hypothetical protein